MTTADGLRIGVMGAGSIGCFVGGKLLAAGVADVVLVGRGRVRDEIAAHGLRVQDVEGEAADVPANEVAFETDASALAGCDVVLVAVKSAATADVARDLADVVGPDALVVSLQNGLRNATILGDELAGDDGGPAVAASVVGFNVVSRGEGLFHRGMSGPLLIESVASPLLTRLCAALNASGIETDTRDDLAPDQWTKLLVNLNNAVSALSDAPTRQLLINKGYRHIVAALVSEAMGVLKAAGIKPAKLRGVPVGWMPFILRLPTPLVRLVTRAQMKVDPQARSSMWEDLRRGRPTEVDFLNGEIVRLAERVGAEAPLNRRIVELVRRAEEADSGSPGYSPDAFWTELRA